MLSRISKLDRFLEAKSNPLRTLGTRISARSRVLKLGSYRYSLSRIIRKLLTIGAMMCLGDTVHHVLGLLEKIILDM